MSSQELHLSAKQLQKLGLNPDHIPQHVAIIMDGNGRWAKRRLLPRKMGHKQGAEALRTAIHSCAELGIRYLSVYVFSTENWKRPEEEVSFLMNFFTDLIQKEAPELNRQGVCVRVLGDLAELDSKLQEKIKNTEKQTENNTRLQLNLMMNYGSRRELTQACQSLADKVKAGELSTITESDISEKLYTKSIPDPDILIRTGGDTRVSNFLLWQIAYSECFFLDQLWPDFCRETLLSVVKDYQHRDRRYGGLNL